MKTKYLLIILFLSLYTNAQNLGTDLEGYSTIYTEGTSLNLNVVDNKLEFNYFNSKWLKASELNAKKKKIINKGWFWGGKILGDANDGISNIISSGKINAGFNLDIVVGKKLFTSKKISRKLLEKRKKKLADENSKLLEKNESIKNNFLENIETLKRLYVEKLFLPIENDNTLDKNLVKDLKTKINQKKDWSLIKQGFKDLKDNKSLKKIKDFEKITASISSPNRVFLKCYEWNKVVQKLQAIEELSSLKDFDQIIEEIDLQTEVIGINSTIYFDREDEILDIAKNPKGSSTSKFLLKFGLSKQDFKYDLNNGGLTSAERLSDEEFTGLSFDLIYNIQWSHNYFWGLSFRGERANNFSALESKEITFGEAGTENSETLSAFAGAYDTFNRYSLNTDFMWINKIEPQGDDYIYLIVNPYIRHFIYDNADQLRNNTNIGLGLNLFNSSKGKILGGAFVQANDVFGVNTRQSLGKSIAFGLSVRVAFKGFNFEEIPN